jgi:membrane protein involved in colicin uptake
MKRTVREKNAIIITFVFYLILVVILILFSTFNITTKLETISSEKEETQKLYDEIVSIEK